MAEAPLDASTPAPTAGPGGDIVAAPSTQRFHAPPTTSGFSAVNARPASLNTATASSATDAVKGVEGGDARPAPEADLSSRNSPSANADASSSSAMTSTVDATYGTRSRNRTGNSRVNYAEDQDMDFEYTSANGTPAASASSKKKPSTDATTTAAGSGPSDTKRSADVAKFVAVNGHAAAKDKESTPSSTAGSSAPTVSKKRKAAAPPSGQHSSTPPAIASGASQSLVRKPVSTTAAASVATARETNLMTFTKSKACLNKRGELVADDGTRLSANDHVYLVSEPPGEPYYLCRIMEFLHTGFDDPTTPVDSVRVNWFYRPRDVQRFNSDTRLVYGTMHSDMCPITSLRGKCNIKHRSEIDDLDVYRKERDSFYWVQVFDRFIRRSYECIPVSQIINVPENVKKALDERWKFVVVEIGRVKELTSAVKTCKRCSRYCASNDSVDCAICKNSYHMNCVQPPLPKKPSRGFAWACGPCSRATEKKMEARHTPSGGEATDVEEEPIEGEEEVPETSNDNTRAPSPSGEEMVIDNHPATQAEIALAKMWPMRYLGIHCRVEDALQYDDRAIYPRASSRLGPRHQANTTIWHGRPIELVKPAEIRKRYAKGGSKKDTKLTKETLAAIEADREERAKRPKWVQDEPPGYVARGEDYPNDDPRCTAHLVFQMPKIETASTEPAERERLVKASEAKVDGYVTRAKKLAPGIGVPPFGVNFLDKALELLAGNEYREEPSLAQLGKLNRVNDLHEPVLSKVDLAKFEEGVAKHGSEHRLIRLHMKTHLPNSAIVRFYYLWKKTPKGREIWGNYGGRKNSKRKLESDAGARLQVELSHDVDDSAFDQEKAVKKSRAFQCKFCLTQHSRQWRKAPGVSAGQTVLPDGKSASKDKRDRLVLALCLRCAGLWRKYAIQWEDIDEVAKKVASGGGRAWKKRIDEELLRELLAANDAANNPQPEPQAAVPTIETGEPPKKKSKADRDAPALVEPPKKKEKPPPPPKEPTPPPPPIIPAQPTWKVLPCAVCKVAGNTVACDHCKLTVHHDCYGLAPGTGTERHPFVCEQCQNDRNPTVSTDYVCCLCLTDETLVDLVDQPKTSNKKKTDRDREKERMEKELADAMRADYRTRQSSMNRPLLPREPLKRTVGNNWVHVHCAIMAPEIRFSCAKTLELAEGFQTIPQPRFEAVCKLCKNRDRHNRVRQDAGVCASCHQCQATFHTSCALEAGYQFGFDVTPVKGSRKDQITTATMGEESGLIVAAIWCKEHVVKSIIHPLHEKGSVLEQRSNMQVYAETYKQADLQLTGTVRKAIVHTLPRDKPLQNTAAAVAVNGSRRESTANSIAAAVRRGGRTSSVADLKADAAEVKPETAESVDPQSIRRCVKCKIDATPKWHAVTVEPPPRVPTPPRSPQRRLSMTLGEYADLERQRSAQAERDASTAPAADISRPSTSGPNGHSWDRGVSQPASRPQQVNGDQRPADSDPARREKDDDYHNHALPRYQNPAEDAHAPDGGKKEANATQHYLCHKCFVRQKLNPTPSPPPPPAPQPIISPPKTFSSQLDWNRFPSPHVPPPQPQQPPSINGLHRPAPAEEPRQSQPPPGLNGYGHLTFGGHPPPPPPHTFGSAYPPYGSQSNGYRPPPPPPPAARPQLSPHERHPGFGYAVPQPPNQPPQEYSPFGAPRQALSNPPPPPAPQPGASTMSSPHGSHPSLPGTSSYTSAHAPFSARRTESPFASPFTPGPPLRTSPQVSYNRPDGIGMTSQPLTSPPMPFPPRSTPPTAHASMMDSQLLAGRPPSAQDGPRPPQQPPSGASAPTASSAASASPSLRNLLH